MVGDVFAGDFFIGAHLATERPVDEAFAGFFFGTALLAWALLTVEARPTGVFFAGTFFAGTFFAGDRLADALVFAAADLGALAIVIRISSSKEAAPRLADHAVLRATTGMPTPLTLRLDAALVECWPGRSLRRRPVELSARMVQDHVFTAHAFLPALVTCDDTHRGARHIQQVRDEYLYCEIRATVRGWWRDAHVKRVLSAADDGRTSSPGLDMEVESDCCARRISRVRRGLRVGNDVKQVISHVRLL